jgi:hypothetical protein
MCVLPPQEKGGPLVGDTLRGAGGEFLSQHHLDLMASCGD